MWFGNQYSEVLSIKFVELLLLVSDCCSAPILLQYGIAALLRNFTYRTDIKAPPSHKDSSMCIDQHNKHQSCVTGVAPGLVGSLDCYVG